MIKWASSALPRGVFEATRPVATLNDGKSLIRLAEMTCTTFLSDCG
jgi:hypothetical protein